MSLIEQHLFRCAAADHADVAMQLVELKSGETYNGHLVNCDSWMNIHLREVICTSKVTQGELQQGIHAAADACKPAHAYQYTSATVIQPTAHMAS